MSIELCVLGSGSSGNSTLVRVAGEPILIDAGFGPRTMAKRLIGTGVELPQIKTILLTHLDRDHFAPTWLPYLVKNNVRLCVAERHRYALSAAAERSTLPAAPKLLHKAGLLTTISSNAFTLPTPNGAAMVRPVHLAYDNEGTVGFIIEVEGQRLGYATDLGHVPDRLVDALVDCDMIALESNYDDHLQESSSRPVSLKRRVMGNRGHLSNGEALATLRKVFDRSTRLPEHVVLLHLSRQCNCRDLVTEMYRPHPTIAERLCLSSQSEPTGWLRPVITANAHLPGEQLRMFA